MTYFHTTVLEGDVIRVTRFIVTDTVNVFAGSIIKRFPRCEGHCHYRRCNLGSEFEGCSTKLSTNNNDYDFLLRR